MNFKICCRSLFLLFVFPVAAQASELYDVLPFGPYRNDMPDFTLGVQLDTAVTYDFVSAMQALLGVKNSSALLQDALQNRYGINEETFSRLRLGYYHLPGVPGFDLMRNWYLEGTGEFDFWGLANNPVLSELHGRIVYLGVLSAGFTGNIPSTPIGSKIAFVVGKGISRDTDVISPDLTSATPIVTENLQYYGMDLGLYDSKIELDRANKVGASFDYHGGVFFSDVYSPLYVNRWKFFSFYENQTLTRMLGINIRPHLIMGQQPLPFEFLPRGWDYIHQLNIPNSFFAWSGIGIDLFLNGQANEQNAKGLKGTVGVYGGFVGGSLSYEVKSLLVKAGTWEISVGPDFQLDTERFWEGSLGFQF